MNRYSGTGTPSIVEEIGRVVDAAREREQAERDKEWERDSADRERVEEVRRAKLEQNIDRCAYSLQRIAECLDLIRCNGIHLHK